MVKLKIHTLNFLGSNLTLQNESTLVLVPMDSIIDSNGVKREYLH